MAGRIAGQKLYPPSQGMVRAAREGLQLQQQYGRGESKHRLIRARKIAAGQPLPVKDWRAIAGFQARSFGDANPSVTNPYPDGSPDARYIASLLLGGDEGQDMAFNLIPKINLSQ